MVAVDVTVPPGSGVPPHRHASAETFLVLSGRLTVARAAAGGAFEEIEAGPGDMIAIPADTPHGYHNAGPEPVVFMAVVDPALAAFFEAAAAPERPSGPPTPEAISRIMALAEAHGIRMLQPA
jgi:quercetin dioxygenase-like cupin family protein